MQVITRLGRDLLAVHQKHTLPIRDRINPVSDCFSGQEEFPLTGNASVINQIDAVFIAVGRGVVLVKRCADRFLRVGQVAQQLNLRGWLELPNRLRR